jgi:hypothetical protein
MIKNRETLKKLCDDQLEEHDAEAAMDNFDELMEMDEHDEESAFDEVVDIFDIDLDLE